MAGCSSGIRFTHFTSLKNEIFIMGSIKDSNFMFVKNQDFVGMNKIGYLVCQNNNKSRFLVKSSLNQEGNSKSSVRVETVLKENDSTYIGKDVSVLDVDDNGGVDGKGELVDGNGGNGKYPGSGGPGGGGGGGDNEDGGDEEEEEFGPLLKFEDVMREAEARGAKLPADMIEAAKSVGIRKLLLLRYLDLQGSAWFGAAMRSCAMLRNRMLADPSFLFKVGTEIVIDTTCATVAEVQKRGKDFWTEFELYAADMLVGVAVNVALVGLLAPYARIGQPSVSQGFVGRFQRAYGALPSSVFEAERPGCRFSVNQRIAAYFYKGILYGFVGFGCGIIGQGIANMIMTAKRFVAYGSVKKSEHDVPVPPLIKSAVLWGVFLGVSSNTRLQIVTGLERLVESSPMGKQFPPVAMAFTVGVRFANNVYAGMQFVDWARWSGVQ
ncbi:protein RETICULATA, chloroplastic isoform X1 [Lycium barbarum]|uniref:protein RETICULATA, chloroplastic isoform X1 n=1 Tax=Lycium barbarum TaxID=112863 RepID=UPI00293E0561|nr:protein RETICULATA, chloroplastic isoform X1 [Lycium barbarum]